MQLFFFVFFSYVGSVPHGVPQVLINREPLLHMNFDVELLGDCDVIVNELCHRLGGDFEQLCYNSSRLSEITDIPPPQPTTEQPGAKAHNTGHVFTEQAAETSETVTDKDSCRAHAQFPDNGGLNTPCTAKEARPSPELDSRSCSPKPSTQQNDGCLKAQPSPCQQGSDGHQHSPPEAVGPSPNPQQKVERTMAESPVQTEEKHTHQRNDVRKECWLKQISRNPISNRLGSKIFVKRSS